MNVINKTPTTEQLIDSEDIERSDKMTNNSRNTTDVENVGEVSTSSPCMVRNESPSLAETYDMKTDIKNKRAINKMKKMCTSIR